MGRQHHTGGWRRVLRWVGVAVAGVLVLYFGFRFLGNVSDQWDAGRAADQGYTADLPEAHAWRGAVRAALAPTLGEPAASREEVACRVTPAYGGWFATDHQHSCSLRLTEVFTVADEREARAVMALLPDEVRVPIMGEARPDVRASDCVALYERPGDLDAQRAGGRFVQLAAHFQPPNGEECRSLPPYQQSHLDSHFAVRSEGSFDLAALRQRPLVVLTREAALSGGSLGCATFSTPIFCDVPMFAEARLPKPQG